MVVEAKKTGSRVNKIDGGGSIRLLAPFQGAFTEELSWR